MKIFNWVHKTFQHSALKDGFSSNLKKTEPNIIIGDSQAFLKEVALADVLGGWKDGILTIGTLGYDPLKSFNQHKDSLALVSEDEREGENILVEGDDEDNYNAEHEELNPLMHTTFEHNFEDVVHANAASKKEVIDEFLLTPPVASHEITESNDVETDQKKKKGERVTLADLFLADSDKIKLDPAKVLLDQSGEKPTLKTKHGLPTFAKKLIPRVKDNRHPIKNIKKLMKRMLKRKIHPELDAKNHKPEEQKPGSTGVVDNDKYEANDLTCLLPI